MNINWKTTSYVVIDTILAVYLLMAVTSFTVPDHQIETCNEVKISISDQENYGFLSAYDIKNILEGQGLYPQSSPLNEVDTRKIEETLEKNSFVDNVECYKTISGTVNIKVNQRMPFIRIMADDGDNYYLDKDGNMMQGEGYTSDLIIATGSINRQFAKDYLAPVSRFITASNFWRYQIEQINILPNGDLEIVPRVGNHMVKVGHLPEYKDKERRDQEIEKFLTHKFQRLEKFYVYGLKKIGWNKYKYINIEFDNQIICKKNGKGKADDVLQIEAMKAEEKGEKEKEKDKEKETDKKDVKEQKQKTENN